MVKLVKENRFQYMKHCPIDGKPLGQTKTCPEHKKSKSTWVLTFDIAIDYIPRFVDPAMA